MLDKAPPPGSRCVASFEEHPAIPAMAHPSMAATAKPNRQACLRAPTSVRRADGRLPDAGDSDVGFWLASSPREQPNSSRGKMAHPGVTDRLRLLVSLARDPTLCIVSPRLVMGTSVTAPRAG